MQSNTNNYASIQKSNGVLYFLFRSTISTIVIAIIVEKFGCNARNYCPIRKVVLLRESKRDTEKTGHQTIAREIAPIIFLSFPREKKARCGVIMYMSTTEKKKNSVHKQYAVDRIYPTSETNFDHF